ncbi:N-acetylmuramoyl-L-alanine amidase family protein [Robertkochia solimangrovi]|uniref:N-acetylmuramoyl-L-alanine amidase family protein n=1 Tax=Robertkochia solimangrovi TaxID=2213046 RepID=UPI00117D9E77|nr:N-acetylmuramoyl-L-alanine amidase [Robertkochia solimangrovi]TRZ42518.1 N-acetylmuramoyl-L-alanine amidase [Robertkochia solimangrovi]
MKRYLKALIFPALSLILFSSFDNPVDPPGSKVFTVVLDAGHGGNDPGNLGSGFKEKDIALSIVLRIGKILEQDPNIKVIYTRKTDVFIELFERGAIANRANADLFVSVHCNAHDSNAHGTETWVLGLNGNKKNMEVAKKENSVIFLEDNYEVNYEGYDMNAPESILGLTMMQEEFLDQSIVLAKNIQDNFTQDLHRKDRGVKQNIFIVLHQTFMPSVLVETGFLTYQPEGAYLNSGKGKDEMAKSIAEAVVKYKRSVENFVGEDFSYELGSLKQDEPLLASGDETATIPVASESSGDAVIFKVQISAGANDLELQPFNFNGLDQLSKQFSEGIYRYYYGNTSNWEEAKKLQQNAVDKGFGSCFIVAYKNGEKINLETAVNSVSH